MRLRGSILLVKTLMSWALVVSASRCPYRELQMQTVDSVLATADAQVQRIASVFDMNSYSDLQKLIQVADISSGSWQPEQHERDEDPQCASPPLNCVNNTKAYYYRTLDGACNNLIYPGYGMTHSRYTRILSPNYGDRVYTPTTSSAGYPLPNPRLLSLTVFGEETRPDSYRTTAFCYWGQLVAHDISRFSTKGAPEDCCSDNDNNSRCYPITLYPHDPIYQGTKKQCLHFSRAASDMDLKCPGAGKGYAEKISLTTSYLDLSPVYGESVKKNNKIRAFEGGQLKSSWIGKNEMPPISKNLNGECGKDSYQCFDVPDGRNRFVPPIALLHTILLREHNRIAKALAYYNPQWSDERLFEEARKINIAQYAKITYYDWLPLLLGPTYTAFNSLTYNLPPDQYANDYDPHVETAPYAECAAAALRYAHSLIPGWFSLYSSDRSSNASMRLSEHFDRAESVDLLSEGYNFESLIRGLATQLQKRADNNIDKEIKHHMFRKPSELFGEDLKAMDILRGRDFGLPSYNDLRAYCGLQRAYNWRDFGSEISSDKIQLLSQIYASPDDVELSVGASLESHAPQANLGPTFQCIIARQFLTLRTGDRFFFEHENAYSGFTRDQLAEIRKASLAGLFCANAKHLKFIQRNVFTVANAYTNCHNVAIPDLSKWREVPQEEHFTY